MTDRITLNVTTFMKLDGQWGLVGPGTVIDTVSASNFSPSSVSSTTPGGGGTLIANNGHTSVGNPRRL